MKLTVLILTLFVSVLAAEPTIPKQKPTAESIARTATLLGAVAEHRSEFKTLLTASRKAKPPLTETKRKRLESLREELHEAMAGVVHLKTTLQKDQSISDYPGLLALGVITYDVTSEAYELEFLGGHSKETGTPYSYIIHFDRYGRITGLMSMAPIE